VSHSHRRPKQPSSSSVAGARNDGRPPSQPVATTEAARNRSTPSDREPAGSAAAGRGQGLRRVFLDRRLRRRVGLVSAVMLLGLVWLMAWRPWFHLRHLQSAREFQRVGELAAADAQLQAALRLIPNDPETLRLLARNARRVGDLRAFRRYLDAAREQGADPDLLHREQILSLAQVGQLREAEPELPTLLQSAEGDEQEICRAFVQGYLLNLRLPDADRLLDSWERDYPQDHEPYLLRGYARESVSQYEAAEIAYRQALKRAPYRSDVTVRLAQMLLERRQIDEAYRILSEARERTPDFPPLELTWAQCLHQRGEFDAAREVLQRSLTANPDDAVAAGLLGRIQLAEQQWDAAIQWLQVAARLQPRDTTIRYALGQALQAAGRRQEAQGHFDYVAEAAGPLDELEATLERILGEPENAELRYRAGSILLEYGSAEDGAKWLRSALQIEPQLSAAHAKLAQHHARRGESASAQYHLRAAKLGPADQQVEQAPNESPSSLRP
jgi:tetratricopeptide (TPR) repeat protein